MHACVAQAATRFVRALLRTDTAVAGGLAHPTPAVPAHQPSSPSRMPPSGSPNPSTKPRDTGLFTPLAPDDDVDSGVTDRATPTSGFAGNLVARSADVHPAGGVEASAPPPPAAWASPVDTAQFGGRPASPVAPSPAYVANVLAYSTGILGSPPSHAAPAASPVGVSPSRGASSPAPSDYSVGSKVLEDEHKVLLNHSSTLAGSSPRTAVLGAQVVQAVELTSVQFPSLPAAPSSTPTPTTVTLVTPRPGGGTAVLSGYDSVGGSSGLPSPGSTSQRGHGSGISGGGVAVTVPVTPVVAATTVPHLPTVAPSAYRVGSASMQSHTVVQVASARGASDGVAADAAGSWLGHSRQQTSGFSGEARVQGLDSGTWIDYATGVTSPVKVSSPHPHPPLPSSLTLANGGGGGGGGSSGSSHTPMTTSPPRDSRSTGAHGGVASGGTRRSGRRTTTAATSTPKYGSPPSDASPTQSTAKVHPEAPYRHQHHPVVALSSATVSPTRSGRDYDDGPAADSSIAAGSNMVSFTEPVPPRSAGRGAVSPNDDALLRPTASLLKLEFPESLPHSRGSDGGGRGVAIAGTSGSQSSLPVSGTLTSRPARARTHTPARRSLHGPSGAAQAHHAGGAGHAGAGLTGLIIGGGGTISGAEGMYHVSAAGFGREGAVSSSGVVSRRSGEPVLAMPPLASPMTVGGGGFGRDGVGRGGDRWADAHASTLPLPGSSSGSSGGGGGGGGNSVRASRGRTFRVPMAGHVSPVASSGHGHGHADAGDDASGSGMLASSTAATVDGGEDDVAVAQTRAGSGSGYVAMGRLPRFGSNSKRGSPHRRLPGPQTSRSPPGRTPTNSPSPTATPRRPGGPHRGGMVSPSGDGGGLADSPSEAALLTHESSSSSIPGLAGNKARMSPRK